MNRLEQQLAFIKELDKLKEIHRRSYLLSQSRNENTAEHCWHVAMMATILSEYSDSSINVGHVVSLLLVHDIVEIDAGDTFYYDEEDCSDKDQREKEAAKRIFNLLPEDQAEKMMRLWMEYESSQTPESRFANALDRLMPLIHNFSTSGRAWREHGITKNQVLKRNQKMELGSRARWEYAKKNIRVAFEKGHLKEDTNK